MINYNCLYIMELKHVLLEAQPAAQGITEGVIASLEIFIIPTHAALPNRLHAANAIANSIRASGVLSCSELSLTKRRSKSILSQR